jgi:hypothetical protein
MNAVMDRLQSKGRSNPVLNLGLPFTDDYPLILWEGNESMQLRQHCQTHKNHSVISDSYFCYVYWIISWIWMRKWEACRRKWRCPVLTDFNNLSGRYRMCCFITWQYIRHIVQSKIQFLDIFLGAFADNFRRRVVLWNNTCTLCCSRDRKVAGIQLFFYHYLYQDKTQIFFQWTWGVW